jgi:hypothetical protein
VDKMTEYISFIFFWLLFIIKPLKKPSSQGPTIIIWIVIIIINWVIVGLKGSVVIAFSTPCSTNCVPNKVCTIKFVKIYKKLLKKKNKVPINIPAKIFNMIFLSFGFFTLKPRSLTSNMKGVFSIFAAMNEGTIMNKISANEININIFGSFPKLIVIFIKEF